MEKNDFLLNKNFLIAVIVSENKVTMNFWISSPVLGIAIQLNTRITFWHEKLNFLTYVYFNIKKSVSTVSQPI